MEEIRNPYCDLCSYGKKCKSVCITGVGNYEAPLMIVAESPSWSDDEDGTVMQSKKAQFLHKVIDDILKIPRDQIYITYLLKCKVPDGKKPTKKEIQACMSYLDLEILKVKPKAIVTLGELAMNYLCGTKKITKWRGSTQLFETQIGKIPVIPTYSPVYIENAPNNLSNWVNDILKAYNVSQDIVETVSQTKMIFCDSFQLIKEAVSYCKEVGVCSFDFETPEIDKEKGTFVEGFYATTLSLSFQAGSGYVIPLEHQDSPYSKEEVTKIMNYLKQHIFENPEVRKIGHNLNYDFHIARLYGITKLRGRIDDTMLMSHLVDETRRAGLKELVSFYFPEFAGYEDELEGFGWTEVPIKTLAQYNATDTDLTLRLCVQLESELIEDERSYYIYRNLSMSAFRPLWYAEKKGMWIKRDFLREAIKETKKLIQRQDIRLRKNYVVSQFEEAKREEIKQKSLEELEEKLFNWLQTHREGLKQEERYREKIRAIKAGEEVVYSGIQWSSWQQLEELLYDHPDGFNFNPIERGTGKDIIKELPDKTGFIENLLIWRSLNKTLSTYLLGIYNRIDADDYLHTSFRINGTASGRLSSANPNLQNIPNTGKLKNEDLIYAVGLVKKSFGVPDGYTLFQADFSQAELRIIASFANEDNMLSVYQQDGDIHSKTASNMLGIQLEEFDKHNGDHKAARSKAKAVNFGLIYGMSAGGFQNYAKTDYGIEMTYEEAVDTRNTFFDTYPRLLNYHETYVEKGKRYGWVRTLFGRRRRLPHINSQDGVKASMDERVAINSPVQGTAGEMTVFAIALLYFRLDPRVFIVNTVHDSIIFYIPDDLIDTTLPIIKYTLENLPTKEFFGKELTKVGMKIDLESSKESWGQLEEYNF